MTSKLSPLITYLRLIQLIAIMRLSIKNYLEDVFDDVIFVTLNSLQMNPLSCINDHIVSYARGSRYMSNDRITMDDSVSDNRINRSLFISSYTNSISRASKWGNLHVSIKIYLEGLKGICTGRVF